MSYVIILLSILVGSGIVGATFAYFIRARKQEEAGGVSNIASAAAPVPVAEEVKAIGEQIERAMSDQRLQGETQRQLIAQKLESVRHSVEAQKNQVQGLRSEFLHESRRRDEEIATIRQQIGTIQETVGLPASTQAALPPATPPAPPAGVSPQAEPEETFSFPLPDPTLAAPEPAPEPDQPTAFEETVFAQSTTPAPAPAQAPSPPSMPTFEEATFSEEIFSTPSAASTHEPDVMQPAAPPMGPEPVAAPGPAEAPAFEDTFAEATFSEATFSGTGFSDASQDDTVFSEGAFEDFAADSAPPSAAPVEEPPVVSPEADPFATAPLYDENVGGDSASSSDLFESWSPEPVAPPRPSAPPASSHRPAEAVAVETPPPFDTQHTAWISRPSSEPDAIQTASADEFINAASFDEAPAPPSFDAPSFDTPAFDAPALDAAPTAFSADSLIDLDSLMPPTAAPPTATEEPTPTTGFTMAPVPVSHAPATPPSPAAEADPEPFASDAPTGVAAEPDLTPTPTPPSDAFAAPEDTVLSFDAFNTAVAEPADAPEVEPELAYEVPEGAEDLTVIASVDEDVQRLLYIAGVRTLEEIAQWGRGEARRISSQVNVSEDTIMNQWVFEAQAALFNRYSQQG